MSEALLNVVTWLLVPMGVLPVITAIVLAPHVNSASMALKERARLSIVLALLGVIVAVLALNRLLNLGLSGAWLVLPFATALLLVDGASGVWLWQYLRNRFR